MKLSWKFYLLFYLFCNFCNSQLIFSQDSKNCNLIAHWNYGTCTAVEMYGNIIIYNDGSNLCFMDYSDPANPINFESIKMHSLAKKIVINNNQLFVLGDNNNISIYNSTDFNSVAEIGYFETNKYINDFEIIGNNLLAIAENEYLVYDISDPMNITNSIARQFPFYFEKLAVENSRAYTASYDSSMRIFDLSDILNPTELGSLKFTHRLKDIDASGDYVVASQSLGIFKVMDCNDSSNPLEIYSYSGGSVSNDAYIFGQYAYMANMSNGLRIFDLSDPADIKMIKTIETHGNVKNLAVNETVACYTIDFGGLFTVDITDKTAPIDIGSHAHSCSNTIKRSGDYAYLALGLGGFAVFDVSDRTNPVEVLTNKFDGWCADLYIEGTTAYFTNGTRGLKIFDITDPLIPNELATYPTAGNLKKITIQGNYAFLSMDTEGFNIVDISDPVNPVGLGYVNTEGRTNAIAVKDNYAYIADDVNGLRIFDISDLNTPIEVSFIPDQILAVDLFISDNFAYVIDDYNGMQIIDISDPLYPSLINTYVSDGTLAAVFVEDNLAYITDWNKGLIILDISNPLEPIKTGYYKIEGQSGSVIKDEDYIYVSNDDNGFLILQYDPVTGTYKLKTIKNEFSLEQNYPNPFNPLTNINFHLSISSKVKIVLYNLLGKEVKTILNENLNAGSHTLQFDGTNLSNGVYFYRIIAGKFTDTKKLVILK